MKILPISFLIVFILSAFNTFSQEKKINIKDNNIQKNNGVEFFFNNKKINKRRTEQLPKNYILVEIGDKNNPSDTIIRVRYFSSEELELEYSKNRGIPLSKIIEVEKHLARYAESSGAIKQFEENGKIPEDFIEYERNYVAKNLKKAVLRPQTKMFGMMQTSAMLNYSKPPFQLGFFGKEFYGGSTLVFAGSATPFFPPGWNKKISRYHINWGTFIVYGYFALYDKTFFRKKFYSSWSWTNRIVRFNSHYGLSSANNRAKSAFHP